MFLHLDAKQTTDASSNHVNSTLYGTSSAAGKYGEGRMFNGIRDYVQVPEMNEDYSQGLTVSFWAKPTSNGSWARFMDFGNACPSDNIIFTRYATTNNLMLQTFQGGTPSTLIATDGIVQNEWHHYVFTIDASNKGTIYRDGDVLTSGTVTLPSNLTRSYNYIGKSCSGGDALYAGFMDEFAVLNRAFSDEEVKATYAGLTLAEYQ